MSLSDIIAFVALAIAILTYLNSKRQSQNQENLDAREVEWIRIQIAAAQATSSDSKKADLSARMYKHSKNNWRVKLYNRGPSSAYNVQVELSDENKFVVRSFLDEKLPFTELEKGHSVEFHTSVHLGTHSKEDIIIIWDDNVTTGKRKTVTLTL